jgi:formylglycine-generating enzyme
MERKIASRAYGLAVIVCALLGGAGAAAADDVSIETVPVGNAGNEVDGLTGFLHGAVGYNYNIGKYEVTAGQYTTFLNAVGGVDTYGLYNTAMASVSYGSGISRSGGGTVDDPYTYTAATTHVTRPVNYVSFWDACRFANWLNNGQGDAGTTENGAYTLTADAITNNTVTRNAGAVWAVTSEDEWYKAAYYDPATGNYYGYPTSSSRQPGNNLTDPLGNNVNYDSGFGPLPIDGGKYTTVAGQFRNSGSPYGTFDQGGNVFEWNEFVLGDTYRRLRGGAFDYDAVFLQASNSGMGTPTHESSDIGFRVVQLPEPASLGILGFAVVGMLVRRRGLRR